MCEKLTFLVIYVQKCKYFINSIAFTSQLKKKFYCASEKNKKPKLRLYFISIINIFILYF